MVEALHTNWWVEPWKLQNKASNANPGSFKTKLPRSASWMGYVEKSKKCFLKPEALKQHWQLSLGSSVLELPALKQSCQLCFETSRMSF